MTYEEIVISHYVGLIKLTANQHVGSCRHLEFDDLVSEATIGLLMAVRQGKPESHYPNAIRHAVFRAITNQERAIRLPEIAERQHRREGADFGTAMVEYNDDYQGATTDEYFAELDMGEEDLSFLDILHNPLERAMVQGVVIENATVPAIGAELGLDLREATTRYNCGLAKMRRYYAKLGHKATPATRRIPFNERVLPLRGLFQATWLELHVIRERQIGTELMAIANNYDVSRDVVKRICKGAIDGKLGRHGHNLNPWVTSRP